MLEFQSRNSAIQFRWDVKALTLKGPICDFFETQRLFTTILMCNENTLGFTLVLIRYSFDQSLHSIRECQ